MIDMAEYEDIVSIYNKCTVLNPSERITAAQIKNDIKILMQGCEINDFNS